MTGQEERLPHQGERAPHPLLRRQAAVAVTLLLTLGVAGWGASRAGGNTLLPRNSLLTSAASVVPEMVQRLGMGGAAVPIATTPKPGVPKAGSTASPSANKQVAASIPVPPNPFLPTEPDPLPEPKKAAEGAALATDAEAEVEVPSLPLGEGGIPSLPPVTPGIAPLAPKGSVKEVAGVVTRLPKAPLNRASSVPEVIGLVQGEPPLAVVQFEGQSFYLKIGDQVADTWRLEAIKERSVILRLGGRRVEVPIQGGNS